MAKKNFCNTNLQYTYYIFLGAFTEKDMKELKNDKKKN